MLWQDLKRETLLKMYEICDKCLKEIEGKKHGFSRIPNETFKKLIKNEPKKDYKGDYYLCKSCDNVYQKELFKDTYQNLRKTECNFCKKFLLKDKEIATRYYSLVETDDEGEWIGEKIFCLSCWKDNHWQYLDRNYREIIVNPHRILKFSCWGEKKTKVSDLDRGTF